MEELSFQPIKETGSPDGNFLRLSITKLLVFCIGSLLQYL
jgi:hypothetical protein